MRINKAFIMAISDRSWGSDYCDDWTNYYHVLRSGHVIYLTSYLERYYAGDLVHGYQPYHRVWHPENQINLHDAEVEVVMPDLDRSGGVGVGKLQRNIPIIQFEDFSWDEVTQDEITQSQIDELFNALKASRQDLVQMPDIKRPADEEL